MTLRTSCGRALLQQLATATVRNPLDNSERGMARAWFPEVLQIRCYACLWITYASQERIVILLVGKTQTATKEREFKKKIA